ARSCGVDVADLDQMETEKGSWLVYRERKPGEQTVTLIGSIVEAAAASLPIERPMRWGASRAEFVRPVHWIVMLMGKDVVPANLFGLDTGRTSRGHRFMSTGEVSIASPNDYEEALEAHKVIASFEKRRAIIQTQLDTIQAAQAANVVPDAELLDEVTSLVEWPAALCGEFDPAFLDVPEEALISAMKSHQRYFHLRDNAGKLAPAFIAVANIDSRNPASVIAGNERVIVPRLSDASFFFRQDSKSTLESKLERLAHIVFQGKLGSYFDKARRVEALAGDIAEMLSDDIDKARRAGLLCKTDLVTDMVGEFPELQGIMGGYYARVDGEDDAVADAIAEHYLPVQSGGALPVTRAGQIIAIADKLDTLTGLFGIGQPPTGSRDPFALRRQSIGVLRICIECALPLDIVALVNLATTRHDRDFDPAPLIEYLFERLAVSYQEQGIPVDTFNAVRYAGEPVTELTQFDHQVRALQAFRGHDSAEALVAANKRVANILRQADADGLPGISPALFDSDAESGLHAEVNRVKAGIGPDTSYEAQLALLAELRPAIDRYFDDVLVMAEDARVKQNRLATLADMRALFMGVADVSLLQM
ncbi:MAG TPA: glycine--tRNA ligase subunit beta, partial [Pseudomonadales bacterium]|nr:glycine--tRNA ligase subunit beta [Pseudomonadales bacterium]